MKFDILTRLNIDNRPFTFFSIDYNKGLLLHKNDLEYWLMIVIMITDSKQDVLHGERSWYVLGPTDEPTTLSRGLSGPSG